MILAQLLLVAAVATIILAIVAAQYAGRLPQRALPGLSALVLVALAVMILSDWPLGYLTGFWNRHAVVTETLISVFLAASVYLAFEARQARRDQEVGESIAATALSGIVDHVVDIDLALAYVGSSQRPAAPDWSGPGRPLRWMREGQEQEERTSTGGIRARDADLNLARLAGPDREEACLLVDQAVRRLMAGMRDWAALLSAGREGKAVLERLGRLRSSLLRFETTLGQPGARQHWQDLRVECLTLALGFEIASGTPALRPETVVPPPRELSMGHEYALYASSAGHPPSSPTRTRMLAETRRRLGGQRGATA